MNRKTILASLLVLCSLIAHIHRIVAQSNVQDAAASNENEDTKWARKSGLTPNEVHILRRLAGVENEADGYIDNLDTKSLKSRKHILVVTAGGNGHCLDLYIFTRRRSGFRRIWAAEERGYCRESPLNPEAYATSGGRIVVKIPVYDYERQVNKATDFYTYAWNGRTYKYTNQ